jgi:hypothetical protein
VTPSIEERANANQPDLSHFSSAAEENLTKQTERSSAALRRAPASSDTAASLCEVTARKKGVVEKTHASRHLATSVRFFLNNLAPGRHNP